MATRKADKPSESPLQRRRRPVQARSENTVKLTFEAAAQILQSEGLEALNTNRIAERAGVSIGSLYQYFPNKEALLLSMVEHEFGQIALDIRKTVQRCQEDKALELEFEVLKALFMKLRPQFRVRRVLCDFAVRCGRGDLLLAPLREAEQALQASGFVTSAIQRFVMASAVQGVIRNIASGDGAWLKDPQLPAEVARMLRAYRGSIAAG